jgi:hypothetical protein
MSYQEDLEQIHESLVNGQRKQMVEQIREYGLYDFWEDYKNYLDNICANIGYFTDACISYHHITIKIK